MNRGLFVAICLLSLACEAESVELESLYSNHSPIASLVSLELSYQTLNITLDSTFIASSALSLYARASDETARVYYSTTGLPPTFSSPHLTHDTPYLHLDDAPPLYLVAFSSFTDVFGETHVARSKQLKVVFHAEAKERPASYGYLVPGVESGGFFVGIRLEMNFSAIRGQRPEGQEFAEYYSHLGKGPYKDQLNVLQLTAVDGELQGFEGGVFVNGSDGRRYGVLVPHHNGVKFASKVVRIDLDEMRSNVSCAASVRREHVVNGSVVSTGPAHACITVLDLSGLSADARGFRKGFAHYPHVYLSPGEGAVAVRIDVSAFSLNTSQTVDLGALDPTLGGFSGGFADGSWACFSPFRSHEGPVGVGGLTGVRSAYRSDQLRLRPHYSSVLACVDESAWTSPSPSALALYDFSRVYPDLRGFSDAVKVGRYAYFSPFMDSTSAYSSKVVRLFLGDGASVGDTIRGYLAIGRMRKLSTVLDLSAKSELLRGFSSLFAAGRYLYLVPYRNAHESSSGQRGHGQTVRIDLNDFSLAGVQVVDTSSAPRAQIPSDADVDLRGYSAGFVAGNYAVLVPHYNGLISGKVGRVRLSLPYQPLNRSFSSEDVQVLDLASSLDWPRMLRGFRGGFTLPVARVATLPAVGVIDAT